ncbi:MAG: LVIVD repeat-containing protein, partial [Anaerolineales bacterium]
VGHDAFGGRGWNAGLALQYPCAYIGNRRHHIVIEDVSDPAHPFLVDALPLPYPSEPVELRTVPDLGLLVVLSFSPNPSVITYDVRDCRRPVEIGSLGLGAAGHEFFLWRDPAHPARLLMFVAMFRPIGPDLMVVDLTDPGRPRLAGTWSSEAEGAAGRLHSLSLSPDGRRAYLALSETGLLVADASDFAGNNGGAELRLVRDASGSFAPAAATAAHSAILLSDPRYALVTEEVYECPFAGLLLSDISDEAHPQIVGRFSLPENDPACDSLPRPDAVFTAHNPLAVDDLVFVTWYGGGLQALDVKEPARPRRVGLFVPRGEGAAAESYVGTYPVQMWSYPILRQGLIYVSDIQSGLYILRYTGPGAEDVENVPWAEGNANVWLQP